MLDYEYARHRMVEAHIAGRGISDRRVLDAMREVPREKFVEEGFEEFAYEDSPLPILAGQTISQPFIVAYMIEAAELEASDRVLEVGAGSGYAAAVMSRIAREIHAIERHQELAEAARRRLEELDYRNVEVLVGDGSKGLPAKAPFDAIVVAAGGHAVPAVLTEQLDIGGRLVMPIGKEQRSQRLIRVTRVAANKFEQEDLGGVAFVPLVGEHGWAETPAGPIGSKRSVPELIAEAAEELPTPDRPDFGAMFDRFGDRRVVLLGEASHGTAEFYRARAAITRRLVERHGFNIVAVEADWPDAASVNRYVRGLPRQEDEEPPFRRFPTWMWRNTEMAEFVGWLRAHNERKAANEAKAGFYGLDLYNMSGSIAALLAYLDEVDPEAAVVARERYGCLTPWQNEPATYGRAVLTSGYRKCEEEVVRQCRELLGRQLDYASSRDGEAFLDAAQNARLIASAEKYYRIMYYGGAESWNLRDRHMFDTLEHLLASKGPDAKAVVWAHNSHIGDARLTEMGLIREELNIGQLCRERFGDQAALIGFGTHSGTVAAATNWDGAMEVKTVRPSHAESVERCFHAAGKPRCLVDFARQPAAAEVLALPRIQRFIGVIYRPETELASHYAEASMSKQFDAYVWFDRTRAVTPLAPDSGRGRVPDTFPFGL